MPVDKSNTSTSMFIKYWLPVIIFAIFIFYLSSIPGQDLPSWFPYEDVVAHIIEYAFFAFLINRALKGYRPSMPYIRRFLWVLFLSIIYAISDEFHQGFVLNRSPSLNDLFYDGIGAFITCIFWTPACFKTTLNASFVSPAA